MIYLCVKKIKFKKLWIMKRVEMMIENIWLVYCMGVRVGLMGSDVYKKMIK